jgi:hypothetical protein
MLQYTKTEFWQTINSIAINQHKLCQETQEEEGGLVERGVGGEQAAVPGGLRRVRGGQRADDTADGGGSAGDVQAVAGPWTDCF